MIGYIFLFVLGLRALMFESIWIPLSFIFLTLMVIGAGKVFGQEGVWIGGFIVASSIWLIIIPTITHEFTQSFPNLSEAMKERKKWTDMWAGNKVRPDLSAEDYKRFGDISERLRKAIGTKAAIVFDQAVADFADGKIDADELVTKKLAIAKDLRKLGKFDPLIEQMLGVVVDTSTSLVTSTSTTVGAGESLAPPSTTLVQDILVQPEPTITIYRWRVVSTTTTTVDPVVQQEKEFVSSVQAELERFKSEEEEVKTDAPAYDLSAEVVIEINPKDQKKIKFAGDKFSGETIRPVDVAGRRQVSLGKKLNGRVVESGPSFWVLQLGPIKGQSGLLILTRPARVTRSAPNSEFSNSVWEVFTPWQGGRKLIGATIRFEIVR